MARTRLTRLQYAIKMLTRAGFNTTEENPVKVRIDHNGITVSYWILTGWYSGKGIEPGRGIKTLIEKLK